MNSIRSFIIPALRCATVAVLFAAAQPAMAQTAYVPGGLFVHPTAYIPPVHKVSVYAAAFTQDPPGRATASFYPVSVTYVPTERLQVSALTAYHQQAGLASHSHIGGFLKYQLVPDSAHSPAVAISTAFVSNDHLETGISGVLSHTFLSGTRSVVTLHTGVNWVRTPDRENNVSDFGGYVGAEVPISRQWDIVGETSTRLKFDNASATAIGVMYHSRRGTDISLGFVNTGKSKSLRPFFGVALPLTR